MPKNLKGGNDMLSSHGATDGDERVEVAFLGLASSVMHSVEPSCRISTPVSWKSRNVCAISRRLRNSVTAHLSCTALPSPQDSPDDMT